MNSTRPFKPFLEFRGGHSKLIQPIMQQTLLFAYPRTSQSGNDYIPPRVKIELGARSDHWPAHDHSLHSYLAEHVPDSIKDPKTNVKVLDASRTFWEKATILHSLAHFPEGKAVQSRQSRHHDDLYRLIHSKHKDEALADLGLLERVANHKKVYFAAGWAKYEEAKPGSLKLIPHEKLLDT